MSKLALAAVASLLLATPALANEPYVNLSEVAGRAKELAGQTIKMRSAGGGFQVKKATFFGCAFTSKAKYLAFELTDSTGSAIAYCPKSNKFCGMLDRSVQEKGEAKILLPKVKLPAKARSCAHVQVELVRY